MSDLAVAAIRLVLVVLAFLVLPLVVGQTEHKVMAHMQGRLGPMYAGAFHGWAQLLADGVKFAQKEDVVPAAADRRVFTLAPVVALVPYLVVLIVIPVGPGGQVRPLPPAARGRAPLEQFLRPAVVAGLQFVPGQRDQGRVAGPLHPVQCLPGLQLLLLDAAVLIPRHAHEQTTGEHDGDDQSRGESGQEARGGGHCLGNHDAVRGGSSNREHGGETRAGPPIAPFVSGPA